MALELEERILQEGRPFQLTLSTAADAAEVEFALDTDTPPIIGASGFFEDKMLWISAMEVDAGAASTIEYLKLDDELVFGFDSTLNGVGLQLNGEPDIVNTLTNPNVKDKYGHMLACRNSIKLKNLAGSTNISTVTLWGVYTKRNM